MRIAVAAIVLIAAWLAPSVAAAHAGHHGAPVAGATARSSHDADRTAHRAADAPVAAARQAASTALPAISIEPAAIGGSPCHGSACCDGTGAGCCAPALSPARGGAMPAPPMIGEVATLTDLAAGAGTIPEVLHKPPKSFA